MLRYKIYVIEKGIWNIVVEDLVGKTDSVVLQASQRKS